MRNRRQVWWWIGAVLAIVLVVGALLLTSEKAEYIGLGDSPRPSQGSATASIVVEEFSDFQCPACKSAQPIIEDIIATFGDKINFKYRHFPLVTIHTQAFRAALASECANDQGKFWEYHDLLFENQPNFSQDDLVVYAEQIDLKVDGEDGFAACLDSRSKTDVVRADMREGDERGVRGTPTFYLNGEAVEDWTKLKDAIQALLIGG